MKRFIRHTVSCIALCTVALSPDTFANDNTTGARILIERARQEGAPGVDPETLLSRKALGPVRLTGTIRDVIDDDLDAHYRFLILDANHKTVYCPIANVSRESLVRLIGAEVSILGFCDNYNLPLGRRLLGSRLYIDSPQDIAVLAPPPANPFEARDALDMRNAAASDVHFLGRVKMTGKVLASWDRSRFLMRRDDGLLAKVETVEGVPPANARVEAVGTAESDLFNVNLQQAIWRTAEGGRIDEETVTNASVRAIMENERGQREISAEFYGRIIRLKGIVRNVKEDAGRINVITIENGGYLVPVNTSDVRGAIPSLPAESVVEVTGAYVLDIDNWYPDAPFPRIRGGFVVPRTADDIVVISRPSRWTPGRLLAVIGVLLAALLGFALWNRVLGAVAERRGRQLYREQIQSVKSELKLLERTHLAVELHDAISQYLTGIALELRTVDEFAGELSENARRHLSVASHTLASCRDELRNCLWDLRHNTLDVKNLAEAVRMTILPHIGSARLVVRFDIARTALSENVVHAILQITRELAINAVRHGGATEIRVAGKLDGDRLRFSVRDNGRGFSPDAAPGMDEGHFGLLGVRERIEKFEGTMDISSAPGRGAYIAVCLTVNRENA